MKLSELVFEVVKNVKYLDDIGFNLEDLVAGKYNDDLDYKNSINNAFAPINEAIHRLSDLNKIKYKTNLLPFPTNGLVQIPSEYNIGKIIAIFKVYCGDFSNCINVPYNEQFINGQDCLIIGNFLNDFAWNYYVQYKEDIKRFSQSDIAYNYVDNTHADVELKEYGITDTMCSYIVEYAQGKLLEPIAPELANMHITRSEQYFSNLEEQQTPFLQKSIKRSEF